MTLKQSFRPTCPEINLDTMIRVSLIDTKNLQKISNLVVARISCPDKLIQNRTNRKLYLSSGVTGWSLDEYVKTVSISYTYFICSYASHPGCFSSLWSSLSTELSFAAQADLHLVYVNGALKGGQGEGVKPHRFVAHIKQDRVTSGTDILL